MSKLCTNRIHTRYLAQGICPQCNGTGYEPTKADPLTHCVTCGCKLIKIGGWAVMCPCWFPNGIVKNPPKLTVDNIV